MNFMALIPLIFKYGPLVIAFVQTQGPGLQAFGTQVHNAIVAAKNPDGSFDWTKLLPLAFQYGPQAFTFFETQGVQFQTMVSDVLAALKTPAGASPAATAPAPAVIVTAKSAGSFTS